MLSCLLAFLLKINICVAVSTIAFVQTFDTGLVDVPWHYRKLLSCTHLFFNVLSWMFYWFFFSILHLVEAVEGFSYWRMAYIFSDWKLKYQDWNVSNNGNCKFDRVVSWLMTNPFTFITLTLTFYLWWCWRWWRSLLLPFHVKRLVFAALFHAVLSRFSSKV